MSGADATIIEKGLPCLTGQTHTGDTPVSLGLPTTVKLCLSRSQETPTVRVFVFYCIHTITALLTHWIYLESADDRSLRRGPASLSRK